MAESNEEKRDRLRKERYKLMEDIEGLEDRIVKAGDEYAAALVLLGDGGSNGEADDVPVLRAQLDFLTEKVEAYDMALEVLSSRILAEQREQVELKMQVLRQENGASHAKALRYIVQAAKEVKHVHDVCYRASVLEGRCVGSIQPLIPMYDFLNIDEPCFSQLSRWIREAVAEGHLSGDEEWLTDVNWKLR